jgi:hypothetical protein
MALLETLKSFGSRIMNLATTPVLGPGGLIDTTPHILRSLLLLDENETATQMRILMARRYHAGLHETRLTNRLKEFLGSEGDDFAVRLNFTRKINKVIAERLIIAGFASTAANDAEKARQAAFASLVWKGSRMKGKRARSHTEAVRDGEHYILIDFDSENNRARLTPHQRYTDPLVSAFGYIGDGEGMQMVYPNNDVDQKPEFAVKRWTEQVRQADGTFRPSPRINLYFADRTEKYVQGALGWVPYQVEGEAWPLPWLDQNNQPLGIPVVHVKTPELLPATTEAIPEQRALNKSLVDLLASSDANAFRIMIALGWKPVDEAGLPLSIEPGSWIGTTAENASVTVVEGADLSNQIAVIDKHIGWMSDVTDIPLSLLNHSNQRAAEGTLQEEKESFIAKVRDYAETMEIAYTDAFKIARRVHNAFCEFGQSEVKELAEDGDIEVLWEPFSVRSVDDKAMEAAALKASGVTDEYIQRHVWAIDETEIKKMQLAQMGDGFPVESE